MARRSPLPPKAIVATIAPENDADMHTAQRGPQDEANACLIAVAPDMLEALEVCEDLLSNLARLDDGTPSVRALNLARAAIARARGTSKVSFAPRCTKVEFRDGDPKPSINVSPPSLP
jgi:hypothetical protein